MAKKTKKRKTQNSLEKRHKSKRMNDFLKLGFRIKPQTSTKTFFTNRRTVCVRHKDGHVTEHAGITEPWRYIVTVKKSMDVIDAWIKEE